MRTFIIALFALSIVYLFTIPKQFDLREGSAISLSNSDATFSVVYDYSNSEIFDNATNQFMSVSDYIRCTDKESSIYDQELKSAQKVFEDSFNNYSRKGSIVKSEANAAYKMAFKLDKFCYGTPGGGVTSNSKGWATGSVEVIDTTTGNTVAIFDFNKISACPVGDGAYDLSAHRERGYQLVASYLARYLNNVR